MTDDLVKRLDHIALNVLCDREDAQAVCDAAVRIEDLTAENERLREAFLSSIAWVFDIQVDFKLVPREDEE